MPDDTQNSKINLSRRKILTATGAIGASGLATGLGSQAFFNDSEQFGNNQLVAGELDMKVGFEEHYSDWSEDEAEHAHMEDGELVIDDHEGFMDATLIERWPDWPTPPAPFNVDDTPCEVLGDPEGRPIIELDDVKPGDFGEVTFSFALCDNPGYVWMNGELLENAENGLTEPEADDPDEDDEPGDAEMSGDLADAIQTTIWYDDNCDLMEGDFPCLDRKATNAVPDNNVCEIQIRSEDPEGTCVDRLGFSTGETFWLECPTGHCPIGSKEESVWFKFPNKDEICIVTVRKVSDCMSMNQKCDEIWTFEKNWSEIKCLSERPNTTAKAGEKVCKAKVKSDPPPECAVSKNEIIWEKCIKTTNDCNLNTDHKVGDVQDFWVRGDNEAHACKVRIELLKICTDAPREVDTWDVVQDWNGELVLFSGTLNEALTALSSDIGIPLDGHPDTPFVSTVGGGPTAGTDPNRECFDPETRYCIGFKWELPVDHTNEIQSDSVTFDLGFYTEQCRHNDGSGLEVNDEEVDA